MPALTRRSLAIYAAALVITVLVVGWLVTMLAQRGHAPARTTVAGVDVGGLATADVRLAISALDGELGLASVQIDTGDGVLTANAADLGLSIDVEATVDEVMSAGRGIPVVGWPFTAFASHSVEPELVVDDVRLGNELADLERLAGRPPVEPSITVANGQLVAVAGQTGEALDPADVAAAVRAAGFSRSSITVTVERVLRNPTISLAEAQAVADEGNQLTAGGLAVRTGAVDTMLTPAQLRAWLTVDVDAGGLDVIMDAALAERDVAELLAATTTEPVNARFEVHDGVPVIIPGSDGLTCCQPGAGELIRDAVVAGSVGPVELPMRAVEPLITNAFAERLGIVQGVATFTTQHRAGEPRVNNIHRIADLMRGVVIPPTGTLSMNGQIGPRTVENGFVDAPVISDGRLESDIGGGVSQFATTLFNAAFYAGIELTDYQSHSLYISRYPFGREATMNYPEPDLKITNNTPYGILVWPTYTDTEITVTLYSTPTIASVTQGGQRGTVGGESCVDVRTDRIITAFDGTVTTDTVRARYRAIEGLNCGDPLPPGVSLQRIPGLPAIPPPPSAGTGTLPTEPPETTG